MRLLNRPRSLGRHLEVGAAEPVWREIVGGAERPPAVCGTPNKFVPPTEELGAARRGSEGTENAGLSLPWGPPEGDPARLGSDALCFEWNRSARDLKNGILEY